jgi:hypothetical protein
VRTPVQTPVLSKKEKKYVKQQRKTKAKQRKPKNSLFIMGFLLADSWNR